MYGNRQMEWRVRPTDDLGCNVNLACLAVVVGIAMIDQT
jgi:hypothetical protein